MKTKIFLLFITLFLFAFMLDYNKVYCESLKDLSFSKGENLLDNSYFSYNEYETLYSRKKTYLKYGPGELYFQVEEKYIGNIPRYSLDLYDINFNKITTLYDIDRYYLEEYKGKSYGVGYFDIRSYDNAVSFSFTVDPIDKSSYSATDVELMCFYGNSPKDGYIEYENAIGIIDIETEHPAIEVEYNYSLDSDDIKELINSYDAYDGNISDLLIVDATNYLNNKDKKGRYKIDVKSKDSSENEVSGFFYIDVVDYDDPQIVGPDKLEIPINTAITDDYIKKNYIAADDYDGDISDKITIESEYTTCPSDKGKEAITLKVLDESNNYVTMDVELIFFDNIAPTLTCPDSLEYGYEINMSIDDIIKDNISAVDNLVDDEVTIEITRDTYTGNEKVVGEYEIDIVAKDESLNETKKTLKVIVSDKIKPIIFINTYNLQITSSVNLERIDFDNLLYEWGVIKSNEKYEVEMLVDTYTGHENEEGTYMVSIKYIDSNREEIIRNFQINVKSNAYVIEPIVKESHEIKWYYILGLSLFSLIIVTGLIVIIKKRKIIFKTNKKH